MTADWNISGPIDYAWTPAELAQIARAVQAFQAMLPNATGKIVHLVRLDGVTVLDGSVPVDWPQPDETLRVRSGYCAPADQVEAEREAEPDST